MKINKKKYIIFSIISLIPFSGYLLAKINQIHWIQSIGYRAAHKWTMLFFFLTIISISLLIINLIIDIIKKIRYTKLQLEQETQEKLTQAQMEENIRNAKAQLNVNGKLSDKVIYNRLQSQTIAWRQLTTTSIPTYLDTIEKQLVTMNSYQDKLSRLLINNGSNLTETLDAFDNAEQDMLRKVRKILNCSDVYDSDNPNDIESMEKLLNDTVNTNEKQLNTVKDCLFATTDYLNKQGDSNRGLEQLTLYMNAIKEQIIDE